MHNTLTLRLSWRVSELLLPDLRALLPAEDIQFFSNDLDEQWHYTLLCVQGDDSCSMIVSVILVWRLLGRIHSLHFSDGVAACDLSAAGQSQLFDRLKMPQAVLHIS